MHGKSRTPRSLTSWASSSLRPHPGRPRKRTLEERKAPGQARSKETVNVILEAGARILESEGLRGFNTNAVAIYATFL
jgi:hypothetical protein